MKGRYVLGVGALLLLGGCSSTEQFAKDDPGIMSEIAEAQEVIDKPDLVSNIQGIPSWVLNPPEEDGSLIFAVGTGVSDDMQFSFDKALHSAKITLADKMVSKSSAEIKAYVSDNAKGSRSATTQKTTKISKSGFKQVDVSKYQIEKQYVTLNGRDFRSFVMISLDPSNRVHGEEVNNFDANADAEANAAMDSL